MSANPLDPERGREACIRVLRPCECDVCADPTSRWWQCLRVDTRFVTQYVGPGIDGTAVPTREFVRAVREQYPDAVLIYIDPAS